MSALGYVEMNRCRFLSELANFVAIPSISTEPGQAGKLQRCAQWLADHLRRIGLEGVQRIATSRHPLVYGEWRHAPGKPTLLIYGHYDVQPADSLH